MAESQFNKRQFSRLLRKAMGERKMSEYALHAGISLTYLSELIREQRDNPPMPPTIKKLADRAYNGITYEQLMAAAGHLQDSKQDKHRINSSNTIERQWPEGVNVLRRAHDKLNPTERQRMLRLINAFITEAEDEAKKNKK